MTEKENNTFNPVSNTVRVLVKRLNEMLASIGVTSIKVGYDPNSRTFTIEPGEKVLEALFPGKTARQINELLMMASFRNYTIPEGVLVDVRNTIDNFVKYANDEPDKSNLIVVGVPHLFIKKSLIEPGEVVIDKLDDEFVMVQRVNDVLMQRVIADFEEISEKVSAFTKKNEGAWNSFYS